jgi:hypothetical protein
MGHNLNQTSLNILGTDANGKFFQAWHREYLCTGIKHCQFYDDRVLDTCQAYDNVVLEDIPKLAQSASKRIIEATIETKIKAATEQYYHAFLHNWNLEGPCEFPSGARVCGGQRPRVFLRHGVCIHLAYASMSLIFFSTLLLDVH